jgi:hypothetical protein
MRTTTKSVLCLAAACLFGTIPSAVFADCGVHTKVIEAPVVIEPVVSPTVVDTCPAVSTVETCPLTRVLEPARVVETTYPTIIRENLPEEWFVH